MYRRRVTFVPSTHHPSPVLLFIFSCGITFYSTFILAVRRTPSPCVSQLLHALPCEVDVLGAFPPSSPHVRHPGIRPLSTVDFRVCCMSWCHGHACAIHRFCSFTCFPVRRDRGRYVCHYKTSVLLCFQDIRNDTLFAHSRTYIW